MEKRKLQKKKKVNFWCFREVVAALFFWWSFGILSLVAQTPTQTIRGVVYDIDTQQPVVGATLSLPGTVPLIGTTTDSTGQFRIQEVPVGYYQLEVSFLGYATLLVHELLLESGNEQVLDLYLEREEFEMQPLVLYAPAYSPASVALVSKQVMTIEEARRFPATFDDPARLAASYPGVVTANDQANHMAIRGNSPASMSWYLEGVEIVNPSHTSNAGTPNDRLSANGGGVNILSAQLLGASTLLTSAFPANYGNSLSGIMDMRLRKGNSENYEFTGQVGLIGIDVAAEGPFAKKSDASFLINYRYSTLGILSAMGVDLGGEAIGFQDLSFNLKLPTEKAGKFTFFGMGGLSSNVFEGPRDTSLRVIDKDFSDIEFRSKMGVIGLTHILPIGGASTWRSTIAYSALSTTRVADQLSDDFSKTPLARDTLAESKLSINTSWSKRANGNTRIQVGLAATLMDYQVYSESPNVARMIGSGAGWLLRPYTTLRFSLRSDLDFLAGIHYSYFTFNRTSAIEPRASLRWTQGKQEISLAYGLHSKLQPAQLYFLESAEDQEANRALGFTKAHHIVLAHQFFKNSSTRLKTELYYQRLFEVPQYSLPSATYSILNWEEAYVPAAGAFQNTGKGTNYGLEISWQHFISEGYYYLLSGTIFDSKYQDGEVWRNTRFNSNYLLNLTGGKEFTKEKKGSQRTWGVNLRVSYIGGFWETPIDEVNSSLAKTTVLDFTRAYSVKQPDIFKIDSRFYFRRNRKKSSSTLAIDLQNMTNSQNLAFRYYDTFQERILDKNQLGLIPNLSWRIEF